MGMVFAMENEGDYVISASDLRNEDHRRSDSLFMTRDTHVNLSTSFLGSITMGW